MKCDILVIGGGHAGIEAANISGLMGFETLLVTAKIEMIGEMSCNPSIGGVSKGNIVREVDALGGLMGKIIDEAGIQFKMLNKSKGSAVWGNRAQADKRVYRETAREYLEENSNVLIYQGTASEISVKHGEIKGVYTEEGIGIECRACILACGTFLNGVGHIGLNSFKCGRSGERSVDTLTDSLRREGIESGRLKTGTPARLDKRSIDFKEMSIQEGDKRPVPFSYSTDRELSNRAVCWETRTNPETHRIIKGSLKHSPLYTGKISSKGPRYCPSIEDKVVRFGDRNGHTLFLEPEGLNEKEIYLNGLSTSLPFETQYEMLHTIKGLEKARILRPAYGIEYDYFFPTQLYRSLESKKIRNLFFAGQINGTSGYEEAACQGIIAGYNACLSVKGSSPVLLTRDSSYTGVLIDDLVKKGTEEPYRMFTSRAEYRLLLRQDNADERLMQMSYDMGTIDRDTWERRDRFKKEKYRKKQELENTYKMPGNIGGVEVKRKSSYSDLLKRPDVNLSDLIDTKLMSEEMILSIESDIKYEGFVNKQKREVERQAKLENLKIPEDTDYYGIKGLLTESREKLNRVRPLTIGEASRIPGITPSDISFLLIYLNGV